MRFVGKKLNDKINSSHIHMETETRNSVLVKIRSEIELVSWQSLAQTQLELFSSFRCDGMNNNNKTIKANILQLHTHPIRFTRINYMGKKKSKKQRRKSKYSVRMYCVMVMAFFEWVIKTLRIIKLLKTMRR